MFPYDLAATDSTLTPPVFPLPLSQEHDSTAAATMCNLFLATMCNLFSASRWWPTVKISYSILHAISMHIRWKRNTAPVRDETHPAYRRICVPKKAARCSENTRPAFKGKTPSSSPNDCLQLLDINVAARRVTAMCTLQQQTHPGRQKGRLGPSQRFSSSLQQPHRLQRTTRRERTVWVQDSSCSQTTGYESPSTI